MMNVAEKKLVPDEKNFLLALKSKKTAHVPFWLMRQAGRYLPEYRALRESKGGFLAMAMDPDSACEITLQPIRRYGMDAAIIFSDILVVPHALGQDLRFDAGEGPKLNPVRTAEDFKTLNGNHFHNHLSPVYEALKKTRNSLGQEGFRNTALIGFAGAPWTVASYMVEGGGSKDFMHVKTLALGNPALFSRLIDMLVEYTAEYLIAQVVAGAEAVQLFDSWAGVLSPAEFERWVIAPTQKIIAAFKKSCPDIPFICFPRGAGLMLEKFHREVPCDALALDTSVPPEWAAKTFGGKITLQGNLDPIALLTGGKVLEDAARRILDTLSPNPFVFNLGHGVQKETPPEHVAQLTEIIRGYKRQ